MSRVTPPVNKFTHAMQAVRRISSSAQAARPSTLLESHHSRYLPRRLADLRSECSSRQLKTTGSKAELVDRLTSHDLSRSHSTFGGHRPAPISTSTYRSRPLMQGFRTSAPKAAAHDTSTIDFMFFPEIPEPPPLNPFSKVRVPLLPDNYSIDRSHHAEESLDAAIPAAEILIVAAHPDQIAPTAMTEVVGNDAVEGKLEDLTKNFNEKVDGPAEPSLIKELWSGLVDDIFGAKKKAV